MIKKPDIDSWEMTPFRLGVLTEDNVRWCVRQGAIITKEITPFLKQSFKEVMPLIHVRYPNLPRPFFGDIEIDGPKGKAVEIRFIPKIKP